jgi:tuberous sclerosis protein 2
VLSGTQPPCVDGSSVGSEDGILSGLDITSPLPTRLASLARLCEMLDARNLPAELTEHVWLAVRDLIHPDRPVEARHLVLKFLTKLIQVHYAKLSLLRVHFFQVLSTHEVAADMSGVLHALAALTRDGKDLTYLEQHIGALLLELLQACNDSAALAQLLKLIRDVFTCNFSVLDVKSSAGIVCLVCRASNRTDEIERLQLCLDILSEPISKHILALDTLPVVLGMLCRDACVDGLCEQSEAFFGRVFDMGAVEAITSVKTMCSFLQAELQPSLMRGAVYMLSLVGWGSIKSKVWTARCEAILPAMLAAAQLSEPAVSLEVARSIQRLVLVQGRALQAPALDLVLDIIEAVESGGLVATIQPIQEAVQATLDILQALAATDDFAGDLDRLFEVLEAFPGDVDLCTALDYKIKAVKPPFPNWLENVDCLLHRYFVNEVRVDVKIKVLSVLEGVLDEARLVCDDELIRGPLLSTLWRQLMRESRSVQEAAVNLLVKVASYHDRTFEQTIDALLRLNQQTNSEAAAMFVKALVRIFVARFGQYSTHVTLHTLCVMLSVGEGLLRSAEPSSHDALRSLFELLLRLRLDRMQHAYLEQPEGPLLSPFLTAASRVSGIAGRLCVYMCMYMNVCVYFHVMD